MIIPSFHLPDAPTFFRIEGDRDDPFDASVGEAVDRMLERVVIPRGVEDAEVVSLCEPDVQVLKQGSRYTSGGSGAREMLQNKRI